MSDEVTCGCGAWEARDADRGAGYAYWWHEQSMDGRRRAYCHECHTELSFDASGKPVAEAMVPRAALERAAGWCAGMRRTINKLDPTYATPAITETTGDWMGMALMEIEETTIEEDSADE